MTAKAIQQGSDIIGAQLDANYPLDVAKTNALAEVAMIRLGIMQMKSAEILFKHQLQHMDDLKEVITNYEIEEAKEI